MNNLRKLFLLSFFSITALISAAETVEFTASAPNVVVHGQTFQLVYSVNASAKDLRLPEIADFEIVAGPFQQSSSETRVINGKMSSSKSFRFTYTLLSKKEGEFSIAPASISVDNKKYSSNSLKIKVLPPEKSSSDEAKNSSSATSNSLTDDNLFMRAQASRTTLFEQEHVLITYKIYTKVDLVSIENLKFPDFKGFLMQEIDLPKDKQFSMENYNGKNYNTIILRQILLFPQHAGTFDIEKMACDAVVRIRNARRSRSFFDDFFDSYQDVLKPLSSQSLKLEVKNLPAPKPDEFSGAVGDFKLQATISADEVSANESVTVKLKISGNGNLKLVKNPAVKFPADFEVYEPRVENNFANSTAGVSGSKTIEYLAIPRHDGDFVIPAVKFSYFDTASKTYKTLQSDEFKLKVNKSAGGENSGAMVNNFVNKESVQMLGSDVRHIFLGDFALKNQPRFFFGTFGFALAYLLPLIAVCAIFWFFRQKAKENADLAKMRNKRANKRARKRLLQAEKLLADGKKEAFYSEVLKAIWGYLGDKFSIEQSQLNRDNVEAKLQEFSVSEPVVAEFMALISECEFAQYAPEESGQNRENLFQHALEMLTILDEQIKK